MKTSLFKQRFAGFLILVIGLAVLAGCGHSSTSSNKSDASIHVVAAEDFYGEVAQAVGGGRVHVTSIIDRPNVEPHEFEPTPKDASTVHNADVILYNGLGYDDWMARLVSSSSRAKDKKVIVVGDLMGKKNGENEHLWYAPETMPAVARALADRFAHLDPAHAEYYHRKAKEYIASLEPLQDMIKRLKQDAPTAVAATEPVFDYMLAALNYKADSEAFAKAMEEGTDPSPGALAHMQNDLKHRKVAFFVQNVQVENTTIGRLAKLAKAHRVPIVKVSETLPAGKDYKTWMIDQLKQIEKVSGDQ
ncbi:metal ABC transporter solute-binding protein, Zn/Mn family [Caenibacillus caldisaponilyticus]|uniref:metal ABC transporter solute-binding protein, Zn/Mn family n=1 Tax=Caenibacillus caldisaponilyticus TaxID=1674942 RepID=UPI0009886CF3|nr:zinc ABC transporter substrate-binding protein [Caenibacillus caldisaponilyticus]